MVKYVLSGRGPVQWDLTEKGPCMVRSVLSGRKFYFNSRVNRVYILTRVLKITS